MCLYDHLDDGCVADESVRVSLDTSEALFIDHIESTRVQNHRRICSHVSLIITYTPQTRARGKRDAYVDKGCHSLSKIRCPIHEQDTINKHS